MEYVNEEPNTLNQVQLQGLLWLRICCSQHFSQWKKLEPNEINFSQCFSQKVVSTHCFVFNSLPARATFVVCWQAILQTVWTQMRPDKMLGQIWIQTVWHPDCIKKIQHPKSKIWHNNKHRGIVKAIFETPKADQNTLFRKYVIFEPPRLLLADDLYL